jgi:NAD-dependent DNA ligase
MADWKDNLEPFDPRSGCLDANHLRYELEKTHDKYVRTWIKAAYGMGFDWSRGHADLMKTLNDHSAGRSCLILTRWLQTFFLTGNYECSAGREFSAMVSHWSSKKTTPLRPKLSPDFSTPDTPGYVTITGRCFCLTGEVSWGTRKQCEARIKALGGRCIERPTEHLDYLVAGQKPGSKLQEAQRKRTQGLPVAIIDADYLAGFL